MRLGILFSIALVAAASSMDEIQVPIEGLLPAQIKDSFNETHFGHKHEAIDLLSPRGTPIHAVVSGTIRKLFLSKPGGNTIYEIDNDNQFCYYYAHLDTYAAGLHEKMRVNRGDVIGYVGSTGNADAATPHLHFAISELGPEKEWWKGVPINPYPALMAAANRSK